MACKDRDEVQHSTFSEPTGIYTTTQRDTVPSCIYMVHCKCIAWLLMYAYGGKTQQDLIAFKNKVRIVGLELLLSELTVREIGVIRRHGT